MFIQESAVHMNRLCNEAIGVLREVYRQMGPGHAPEEYREAIASSLEECDLPCERNVWLPEHYKGFTLTFGDCLDFLIDDCLAVQVVAGDEITPDHEARLRLNLGQTGHRVGLLMNFHAPRFEEGLRKVILSN